MPVSQFKKAKPAAEAGNLSSYPRNNSPRIHHSYQAEILKDNTAEFDAAMQLYRSVDTKIENSKSERLGECRQYSWFARNKTTGKVRVQSNHCRLRWCPMCSKLKALITYHSVYDWLTKVENPKLLTLTLRHSNNNLYDQIQDIYYFFRQLRKIKWLKKAIRGGIWFFQIKWVIASQSWHPHLHILLDSDFLPHSELSETWCEITHGSYIVDIRTIRDREKSARYVSRYVSRPAELSKLTLDLAQQVYSALHGRRLAGSWGTAYGVNLTGKFTTDEDEWEKLANWSTVRELQGHDENADKIVAAWRTGEALPDDVTLIDTDNFIDKAFDETGIDYNYDDLIPF